MKSIIKKWAVAAALVSAIFGISISAQAGYGFQKVAYHVNYDDAKRQAGALRNIQNHINAVGAKNMDIRVVMHGKGLSLLLLPEEAENTKLPKGNATDTMQAKIAGLKDQGVTFKVCANTVRGKKINVSDHLYDVESLDIVPSGVAELSELQIQGFTYLRP
jgi:intracellular sulfur oxidation DsrE/DsrF family protein